MHDWEIGAGENIAGWMEERFRHADRLIGIFSDAYCKAAFSQSERWGAYWQDPRGRSGFLVPIEVRKVTEWPALVSPLKRLSLLDLDESEASTRLITFLQPVQRPIEKPFYPGGVQTASPSSAPFMAGGEPLAAAPPSFPAALSSEEKPALMALPVTPHVAVPYAAVRCIDDYEPKPQIFGRDQECEIIVNAILNGKVTLIAGGPGMGKTAVATATFYDPRIVARFGRRRVFASLETASEPRAVLAKLVEALNIPPIGDEISLLRIVETNAAEKPLAAILDNAETVFDGDRRAAERLVNLLAQVQGLSLVVTIRGVAPPIPTAVQIDDLPKLDASAARDAFLAVSGSSFVSDRDLPHLLQALDGHALSIRLIAAQAIGSPSLRGLRESWDDAHAEILRISGESESRLTSVRASLALSLNCRRMKSTPHARRLISLLAYLPGGLAEVDVRALIGERGALTKVKINEAVACLHQLRLVERRLDSRLRILTPLRECVKEDVLALEIDREKLVEHFLRLAAKAKWSGRKKWEQVRKEVEPEVDNLDAICNLAVVSQIFHPLFETAISGVAEINRHSGRGTIECLKLTIERLRHKPPSKLVAQCYLNLGMIAFQRDDNEVVQIYLRRALEIFIILKDSLGRANSIQSLAAAAHGRYEHEESYALFREALAIYNSINDILGQANCINGMASIALGRSDHDTAMSGAEEALSLYREVGDVLGEVNCIRSIAAIACQVSDYSTAWNRAQEALGLIRSIGSVVGEVYCMMTLGVIARQRSDDELSKLHFEEALVLCRQIGIVREEASCIAGRGEVAFARSDYEVAHAHFEEALALFRRAKDIGGEAEVLIKLGRIRRITGRESGIKSIETGFKLYFEIGDQKNRALAGWHAMHRALVCDDVNESREHRATARSCWAAVGRLDLVHDWVDQAW